jgi:DnaK suppressor protein
MNDTSKYKELLETEKTNLEKQLATIARPNTENPGQWEAIQVDTTQESDLHDQADLLDQYQENRALVDVLNPRHTEVVAALERIKEGSYGICMKCHKPIEEERLNADPAAMTCKEDLS